mmetsp:Transcript_47702/g.85189  ORF Transcript_47702/g.85189 Transcript_47702/m.85189 type:complete len:321 (-) Transcript_47702:59-1021(-)
MAAVVEEVEVPLAQGDNTTSTEQEPEGPRITNLPSLPFATKAIVSCFEPPVEHFIKFGGEVEEGEQPHMFDDFYPKKGVRRRADEPPPMKESDFKFDPFSQGRKVKEPQDHLPHSFGSHIKWAQPGHNLYLVNKAFLPVLEEGEITPDGMAFVVESTGPADATAYVNHIFACCEPTSEGKLVHHEVMTALDALLNTPKTAARVHTILFDLFDEYKCHFILRVRLLELRAKRREDNGQTHQMIKSLLTLMDRLEAEADEAAAAGGGKKKKKALPAIQKCVRKMQISKEEFAQALRDDPSFVLVFLPPILMCLPPRKSASPR